MKDMITTIASIMILMIFVLQFVANQTTYTKLVAAESCVSEFSAFAEERGEIASEDINTLREKAALFLDCTPEEIQVDTRNLESGNKGYDICVPLKNVIGAAKLLGISSAENEAKYHFRGVILTREEEEKDEERAGKDESGQPESEEKEEAAEEAENEEYDNNHGNNDTLLCAP